jgi:CelD/BcsL family acetyltransferase involved in cellulose biosynthesis
MMPRNTKITICRSVEAMRRLRPLWESLCADRRYTVFQNFGLNFLAAEHFAGREEPYVIRAESPGGAAIIPAALRKSDGSIRLLGEELFDYRCFLHQGDPEILRSALAALAELQRPLEIVALPATHIAGANGRLELLPFAAAPFLSRAHLSAEQFAAAHPRLARNLRRMSRLGFDLRCYDGAHTQLLRSIYAGKAAQSATSLFHDSARIEFMVRAAALMPQVFEIFTLEDGPRMAAALVTLREPGCRRFYTGWFAPFLGKHSPALSLIYEVTRQSLLNGLDCDYMTGEQAYKMRLATSSVPLYRLRATAEQLRAVETPAGEMIQAA